MRTTIRAAGALFGFLLAASGCVRFNPLYGGPDYDFRGQSTPWEMGKKFKGSLDPKGSDAWAKAVRFELAQPGDLKLLVKPSNSAVQLNVDIYSSGKVPIASTEKEAKKELVVQDLQPDTYFVRVYESWRSGEETSFELTSIFKPKDPDHAQGPFKTQAGARELAADKGRVEDSVDYSTGHRTAWWKITMAGQGGLQIKFENNGNKIDAFLTTPEGGAPAPIDATVGFKKDDIPAGDYFVKVEAHDAGDAGKYELKTTYKQGDVCKNGGENCAFSGALELKKPTDNKKSDVDYTKGKAYQWFMLKFAANEKGKLTINAKAEGRGAKIAFGLLRKEDDEPEVINKTLTKDVTEPGEYYIKVAANEPGEHGKFVLQTIFQPANFITGEIREIGSPCHLVVGAGANQGVRSGAACTVVNSQGQVIDSCMVDSVFPNLSRVKPMGSCSKIPKNGSVQISQ